MVTKQEVLIVTRDEKDRIISVIDRVGLNYGVYVTETACVDEVMELLVEKKLTKHGETQGK